MIGFLDKYIKEAKDSKFISPRDFSKNRGIYLIFKDEKIIYIGESNNLYKRINSQHVSKNNNIRNSAFRRSLCREYNKRPGVELKKWILDNCKFKYIEVADKDLCNLVEKALVYKFRKKYSLLNK